ncbi:Nucleoside-triphosphatase THEP1 [Gossypium australe]|uniref:Nucleoside-triphosphatase THEP1 n=1 Tax=Gossypium australe TaxID=47621 RepID=A0A5B6UXM6_9ROSI|nr:Nucleoside-triphosphatase THEP1 [Gossypium australe]
MTVVVTPLSGSETLCLREVFTSAWASGLLPGYICTYVFMKFSLSHGHREMYYPKPNPILRKLVMENEFLDKVEDNAAVRIWLEQRQLEKGDSLPKGYVSELRDFTSIGITQNELHELKEIWTQWDDEAKQLFYRTYGDLSYLFDIKICKYLFRAMTQFWNFAYSCFSFGKIDLVLTMEKYTTLLRCSRIQLDKAYSRASNVPTFVKKLMNISRMSEQWVSATIQKKGDALRHVDEAVTDLFGRLDKRVTPVPAILAKTFRSLNACRRTGEGRLIGCAQLLLAWFHSHLWKVVKVSYRVFSKNYSPLKEIVATPRREDVSEENWMALLQNLQEKDIEWKAHWMVPDEILYQCGNFNWVPLLGIWGAIGYAPLLVLRQYGSKQFVPTAYGLAQCEFSYRGKAIRRRSPDREKDACEVPSELEIVKQYFEKMSSELGKRIEKLEEEKMHLKLDADVQKSEAEKLRKEKWKIEEHQDSLKTEYKKIRLTMKNAGLGKTPE